MAAQELPVGKYIEKLFVIFLAHDSVKLYSSDLAFTFT